MANMQGAHHAGHPLSFAALYGRAPTVLADAHGRANLIGEHTDYNGGFVLPTAIPQRTQVELATRDDTLVRAASMESNRPGEIVDYRLGEERQGRDWLDYIQGVTQIMRLQGLRIKGFEARIESTVPLGSGLASSAALEVSLARALRDAFALDLDDVELAKLSQRAENEFVGAHVGIMDQMAASLGEPGKALYIDTANLNFQIIPLPPQVELIVINSGIAHSHAGGEYNTRREECRQACQLLGVTQLRELDLADLPRVAGLPEPLNRRVRHVLTENNRVKCAVEAICTADLTYLGELFYASHASMRDDYEVSLAEIDLMVELARNDAQVYGARLTGGGFGGSVVMLAAAGKARGVAERIARQYAQQTGRKPTILVPPATTAQ